MTDTEPTPGLDTPMPEPGTTEDCWFCRQPVTLDVDIATGWHYWAAGDEPADGVARCWGGMTPRRGVPRTLHVPEGRAWMYDTGGRAMSPMREPYTPRRRMA